MILINGCAADAGTRHKINLKAVANLSIPTVSWLVWAAWRWHCKLTTNETVKVSAIHHKKCEPSSGVSFSPSLSLVSFSPPLLLEAFHIPLNWKRNSPITYLVAL